MNNEIRKNILNDSDVLATTALSIFVSDFGVEALDWFPDTIKREMESLYGPLPDGTLNKLFTAVNIITSDSFFKDLTYFVEFCNFLNHGYSNDVVADVAEIAWAIVEAHILDPYPIPQSLYELFAPEVAAYIDRMLVHSGFYKSPRAFKLIGLDVDEVAMAIADYADDPELYDAFHTTVMLKTLAVDEAIVKRLDSLAIQLTQCGFQVDLSNYYAFLQPSRQPALSGNMS